MERTPPTELKVLGTGHSTSTCREMSILSGYRLNFELAGVKGQHASSAPLSMAFTRNTIHRGRVYPLFSSDLFAVMITNENAMRTTASYSSRRENHNSQWLLVRGAMPLGQITVIRWSIIHYWEGSQNSKISDCRVIITVNETAIMLLWYCICYICN